MLNARDILIRLRKRAFADVTELTLSSCGLQDIAQLQFFKALEQLDLSHNFLQRAHETACLQRLVSLNLSYNRLASFLAIPGMPRLELLILHHNNLIAVNLRGCDRLKQLDVSNNALSEIGGILSCLSLEHLDCSDNRIAGLNYLYMLSALPRLRFLQASGNQAAASAEYRQQLASALPGLELLDGMRLLQSSYPSYTTYQAVSCNFYSPRNIEADAALQLDYQKSEAVQSKMDRIENYLFYLTSLVMYQYQSTQVYHDRIRQMEAQIGVGQTQYPRVNYYVDDETKVYQANTVVYYQAMQIIGAQLAEYVGKASAVQFFDYLMSNLYNSSSAPKYANNELVGLFYQAKQAAAFTLHTTNQQAQDKANEEARTLQRTLTVEQRYIEASAKESLEYAPQSPSLHYASYYSIDEYETDKQVESSNAVSNSPVARTENSSVVQLYHYPMRDKKNSSLSADAIPNYEMVHSTALYSYEFKDKRYIIRSSNSSMSNKSATLSAHEDLPIQRAATFLKPPSAEPQFSDIEINSRPMSYLSAKQENPTTTDEMHKQVAYEFKQRNYDNEKSASIPTRISVTESYSDLVQRDIHVVKPLDDDLDDFDGVDLEPDW